MPRPDFYNDNEYRAYPFIYNAAYLANALPSAAVVDAGIIMGLTSEFSAVEHKVWLAEVTRAGSSVTFVLKTDAPGAEDYPLSFLFNLAGEDWQSEYAANDAWEGFLVAGPSAALAATLPSGTLSLPDDARVLEPARIQSLLRSCLRSISVGNYSRITVAQDPECADSQSSELVATARPVIVNAENLQGPLQLKEGYNCRILQTDYARSLQIIAQRGAGTQPDAALCENGSQLPLYEDEPLPDGSKFYSGGPACDEVVLTINGIGGKNVNIVAGTGLQLTADPETSTLTVEINKNNLANNC